MHGGAFHGGSSHGIGVSGGFGPGGSGYGPYGFNAFGPTQPTAYGPRGFGGFGRGWGVGGPLGAGTQWVSWIHWRDVVDAVCFVHDKADFTGPFNLTSPNPVTMSEFARAIALVLHTGSRLKVPPFALKMVVGDGAAEALLTGQRVVPKKLAQAGFEWSYPDIVPALENLIGPK